MTRRDDLFEGAERAWKVFRSELADAIARHEPGTHILWELDAPERYETRTAPYIQVTWSGPDDILAEVSSNRVLHPRYRASRSALAQLRRAGWRTPGTYGPNYSRPVDPRYADELAFLLVDALRGHFGVVHPAFLVDGAAANVCTPRTMDDVLADAEALASEVVAEPHDCLPELIMPKSRDDLMGLVDRALGTDWSRPMPVHDEDDDIPYVCGSSVVFVRVLPQAPVIRIFAELVLDVTDHDAAVFEMGVLNKEHGGVKFTMNGDTIGMSMDVQALPFVPYHLRHALTRMCELAESLDGVLARRVRGHVFTEPEGDAA